MTGGRGRSPKLVMGFVVDGWRQPGRDRYAYRNEYGREEKKLVFVHFTTLRGAV